VQLVHQRGGPRGKLTGVPRERDVGCGTGILLGDLVARFPDLSLAGVDAAPRMVAAARDAYGKPGIEFTEAVAENLPFGNGEFDLVVSTTSFDHWEDQQQGLVEQTRFRELRWHDVYTALIKGFSVTV
jgi:ubiquinone/menaquinone biosynthesis C-methylase UbiE